MQATGGIEGRVLDSRGNPVGEAAVMLTGSSPVHPDIAALTGPDGKFRMGGLVPGLYEVLVNAEGHPHHISRVSVQADRFSPLMIVLPE